MKEQDCTCLYEGEVISPKGNFVVGDHDCVCFKGSVQCQFRSTQSLLRKVISRVARSKRAVFAVETKKCSKTCHDLHSQEAVCDPKGICAEDHQLYDRNTGNCVDSASDCSCNLPNRDGGEEKSYLESGETYKELNCVDYVCQDGMIKVINKQVCQHSCIYDFEGRNLIGFNHGKLDSVSFPVNLGKIVLIR